MGTHLLSKGFYIPKVRKLTSSWQQQITHGKYKKIKANTKSVHGKYKLFTANIKNSQKINIKTRGIWAVSLGIQRDVLEIIPSFILLVLFSSYPL